MADRCPDILGTASIATRQDDLANKVNAETRREIFTSLTSDDSACRPPHVCLEIDEPASASVGIHFDVDSITGFPSDLAVAKEGVRWHPTQMPISDLQSNLHLDSRKVSYFDEAGRLHKVRRPVHQIPHYTFGRLVGFEDISLYFLFPHLYRETQQSSRLRDEDFRIWIDDILLPIIYEHYSSSHVQHYPSSFDHSRYNATARGVELRGQRINAVSREQQLVYFLPPESLPQVWQSTLVAVQQPGFRQFRDVTILLQAKNLKKGTVNETYVTSDFYFDIATEICPTKASRVASSVPRPSPRPEGEDGKEDTGADLWTTLLWKRCCLESRRSWMQQGPARDPSRKEVFYPFCILQDTGSLTVESSPRSRPRAAGILFTQDYPTGIKEPFAAGKVYPFMNKAIETLALDKSLQRTWELVGGGLSHNPTALIKSYLYTKLRYHFALQGSLKKSSGIRSEHRISGELFHALDAQFRARRRHDQPITFIPGREAPFYSFRTTDMLLGGCWQDVRFQPDPRQLDGLRRVEGLGFRRTMEEFGYAWFLDKIDWNTLTFRQPHAAHMMFNNPSIQAAYHARYGQVRDVRLDFIRMDKARQWIIEFSGVPACLDFLEKYLRQLYLCAFRKDVFRHIKSVLDPEKAEAALAGKVPLYYASIKKALKEKYRPPKLAHGNRLGVKSMDVLFS
ncbi:uncharacterized protein Z520_11982 [Fonsecaea multimorphosa CBS 102226]|uniref:Uncharacterized protein n=1 Tax=Fonsecaea multimorphosa CBS 102226 TaxID=1442371 RepID=A0A0D2I4P1_9EURO|nr:uncharacterized protein Z520_11982 [Fonsecaea multimorphosa CBS 102226]KIX92236.1 hypothetical protein Z520_11982 [Fonsecaea multimorphosa CBS 102226]